MKPPISSLIVIRIVTLGLVVVALAAVWKDKRGWAQAVFWLALILLFIDLNGWLPKVDGALNVTFAKLGGLIRGNGKTTGSAAKGA